MNLHLRRSTCRSIGVYVGVSCKSVPGVCHMREVKQSFHAEISQAAQLIQLSCEAQLCYLKREKMWVWIRNLLLPLIIDRKLLLCLLEQQWNGQRASMELECIKMGIFQDDENIGNSYYPKNILTKKALCDIFLQYLSLTDFNSEALSIVSTESTHKI